MQLADSIYNKTRDICNEVLECIQQPVGFLSMEEETSINPIILTSIGQGATQLLSQKVHTVLPPKTMDKMIRSVISQQQLEYQRNNEERGNEETTIDNLMTLFPIIPETDANSKEYNSLRKSIEESVSLFSTMKNSLQRSELPREDQLEGFLSKDQSANTLMNQSSSLLDTVSAMVDEGVLSMRSSQSEKRYYTTQEVIGEYEAKRRLV